MFRREDESPGFSGSFGGGNAELRHWKSLVQHFLGAQSRVQDVGLEGL